ncbi:MAG TPA: two-component regulator propeller domain-containing protein [Blastocatellia bacterium]|nr:two-component regulator propeller domain-containing protein [Blastocatellia bacterium]
MITRKRHTRINARISASRLLVVALALVVACVLLRSLINTHAAQQPEGAGVIGVVQDDRGEPVADVKVTLTSPSYSSSKLTQADGRFEFRGLKPGAYRLTAEAARFRKYVTDITVSQPTEVVNSPIQLTATSLHVAVVDVGSQPLRNVGVTLYTKERGAVGALVERKGTDEGGDAYFGRLAPGAYQITATLRGYEEYRNDVFISPGITTDLVIQLQAAPVIPINEKALTRYGPPNLPSKNVQAVLQDSEGWMWFGTDRGIARFNGTDFKSSSAAATPYDEVAGEDVRAIAEDRRGLIWFGTPHGVRRVTKGGTDDGAALAGRDVRDIFVDRRGTVWIAAADGLIKFDGKDYVTFTTSQGLPANDVHRVAEDQQGRLWVATAGGAAVIEGDRATPFAQWLATHAASAHTEPPPAQPQTRRDTSAARRPAATRPPSDERAGARNETPAATGNEVMRNTQAVFVDANGTVWMATDAGVWFYDGARLGRIDVEALRAAGNPQARAPVVAIHQDQRRRMWFALSAGGALLYDTEQRQSQRLNFVERDHVAAIYTGREGVVWFATENGVVSADFYTFVSFTTSRGLADNDVQAVIELPESVGGNLAGKLWFLTAGGVSRLDGERISAVERLSANINARAIAFDNQGAIWLATEQGAFRLSGQTLQQFNEGNRLASNNARWVTSAAAGAMVIFATARGATIFRGGDAEAIEQLAGVDVRHVFEDRDGALWFATARGLMRYEAQTGESEWFDTSRGLADNDARWTLRFNDRLLVATRGGIQVCNHREGGGASFSTFDGEAANTMFTDRDGFLWVGTDEGQVKKFVVIGGYPVSTVYPSESFAVTSSHIHSFFEDTQGQIWIATDKGAIRHTPVKVAPPTVLWLEVDGRSDLPTDAETDVVQVPYGQHKLTFHFAAVSMSGQVRYLYRLAGNSPPAAWEVLAVQQGVEREVSRANLGEGAHAFELIALNRDLYGAQQPTAQLQLRVGSPFWKRWWFYALAVAVLGLALGAIFTAHRLREREYVLPKHLRTFQPIEPNPYVVGNPIRTEKMFYGREDDFRYVRTKLEGASQGVLIVFCGERRAGKSSILYQVLNGRLGERFIPVFVDLQEMVVSSDSEFFARVARLIVECVGRANRRAAAIAAGTAMAETSFSGETSFGGASRSPSGSSSSGGTGIQVPSFDGRNPYPIFLDFLDEMLAAIGDRTLLLLMDEYELMEGKVDDGKLSPELFTFLAGLMDNKERLALIFTGSRRLEERDKKYWRELLRRSLFRKVGFLSENDTRRLITEPVADRIVYGRGVTEVIYRLTAGQPFYTQVICQNIVDYLNENEQNWVTLGDLTHVIQEIIDNPLPQMIYSWDGLSDDEKLVLSLLAEVLPDGNDYAPAADLRAAVRANEYPVNLSENTIRLTLEEMFRRELLEKDAADGFRFKIDLFRLWIRRSHSIWQVVKEVRTL